MLLCHCEKIRLFVPWSASQQPTRSDGSLCLRAMRRVIHSYLREARLVDYLIGDGDHPSRNLETKGLCRLPIDDQFELGRLHHRQILGLGTLEDAARVDAGLEIGF